MVRSAEQKCSSSPPLPPIFHLAKGKEEEKKERGNADEEIRRNLKSLLLLFSILEVRERGGGDPIGGAECMGGRGLDLEIGGSPPPPKMDGQLIFLLVKRKRGGRPSFAAEK